MVPPQPADIRPGPEGSLPPGATHKPITVLHWPAQADLRASLVADDAPRLLVLDHGVPPPLGWDDLEDWIRPAAGSAEVAARTSRLEGLGGGAVAAPPLPLLDGDGTLHAADGRVVTLTAVDTRLVHLLLDRCNHVVRRPDLMAAGWPGRAVTERAVDARISRMRGRLPAVGLRIATIRGVGYMLERAQPDSS